jgi:hypothetical protein
MGLALILHPEPPSPNEATILNAWLKVREIQFMNQFAKPRSRYKWKDTLGIIAVVVLFGGGIASCTYMIADSVGAGLECLVVHCVKVIR